ncbi:hypothetical protein MNBD_BACTEROID05-67 [hydrothermal vent metagenome]|uniref:Uncharacterized protein n=1 Tax=hydrothermal vent metagenome TaxID=652676 RepID=A0A3B0T3D0_9ZZZZ
MVAFSQWYETFIFGAIYSAIIIIPCIFIAIIGKNMITKLGTYPTKTPIIQMGVLVKLISIEFITFFLLIAFYQVFSA